jgi:hypothetical protein
MSPGAQNMKTGPDALETAENVLGSAKYKNETRRPRYRRKWVREREIWKTDLTPSVSSKMSSGAQNMKTRLDALGTDENESGRAKHENGNRRTLHHQKRVRARKTWKRDRTPSVPSKTSSGAQNMKSGSDALGTTENESDSAKHENGTRRPRYRGKRVRDRQTWKRDPTPSVPPKTSPWSQNLKTLPDALGTAEIEFGRAKHENRTRRTLHRRKRVGERKTW